MLMLTGLMEPLAKAGYTVPFPLVSGWSAYNSPPMVGWPTTVDEAVRDRTVPTTFRARHGRPYQRQPAHRGRQPESVGRVGVRLH